jgi:hypothetical protein
MLIISAKNINLPWLLMNLIALPIQTVPIMFARTKQLQ